MRRYQGAWLKKRRATILLRLGGRCVQCGAAENLELDHIDPAQKTSHRIWSWSWPRIEAEVAKCQLLCRPCHVEKTNTEKRRQLTHGTATGYRRGCRCLLCLDALYFYRTGIRRERSDHTAVPRMRAKGGAS